MFILVFVHSRGRNGRYGYIKARNYEPKSVVVEEGMNSSEKLGEAVGLGNSFVVYTVLKHKKSSNW